MAIERYLSGEMSPEERSSFEKSLASDPELQADLELELKAKTAIFAKGINLQKEAFTQRWKEHKTQQKRTRQRVMIFVGAVAATVLLLFMFVFPTSPRSPQQLFEAFYERPLAPSIRNSENQDALTLGNIAFNQGNFAEATQQYENFIEIAPPPSKEEAIFYAAISYLELGNEEQAISLLTSLEKEPYLSMGNWYKALAYLRFNKSQEAKETLLQITHDPRNHYVTNAIELLEEMN